MGTLLGPKQFLYRKSCNGISIKFRINIDAAWLVIERPGCDRDMVEIADKDVESVKAEFDAIDNPEKFSRFVDSLLRETIERRASRY